MPLDREAFVKYVAALPAVTLHEQWEACVAKVGGKVFSLRAEATGSIVFKVSETAYAGLTSLKGIGQAPYFAKGQWVAVAPHTALPVADLEAYLAEAHRIIASRLTRKRRAELGLSP